MEFLSTVNWWAVFDIVVFISVMLSILTVITDDRPPSTALAWILLMLFLPVVGLVIYWVFGRNWASDRRSSWRSRVFEMLAPAMAPVYELYAPLQDRLRRSVEGAVAAPVITAIETVNEADPLPATSIKTTSEGEETFRLLLDDLRSAQRFIHMQYFIWECDELTAEIVDILKDRIDHGVEVRVMYDWFGSLAYGKRQLRDLKRHGAMVHADATQLNSLNYRNHRKITVVDAEVGWTGGVNMGQEYIDGGKRYPYWRDQGLRATGPIVAEFQKWFASRWYEDTGQLLLGAEYLPVPQPHLNDADPVMMQLVAHGRDDPGWSAYRAHMIGIGHARKTLRIQSPYFVPDDAIYEDMIDAALSGVDVQFMMTGLPDHKSAFWAAKSYWKGLLAAGGRIFIYDKGFFHAKNMAIDSAVGVVGTMNMDIRSLRLQREMMAWVYDSDFAVELERIFERDKEDCREITLEEVLDFNLGQRLLYSGARLAGNIL